MPTAGGLPGSPGGDAVPTAEGKRGQDTKYGFLSPLDSPDLPSRRDSLRSRSETRGAHRCVWCSKGTPLMEAELFAAERGRPAPNGRALLCAASYARKIQGNKASKNLPDARNRAPVTPVSLHISDVSAQRRVWGSQEGAREPFGALAPFCPRRGYGVSPPPDGGNSPPP